jgi:hypothetical protein
VRPPRTWKDAVRDIVGNLPKDFSLSDVLRYKAELQKEFPNNRFVEAKIRQSLQVLRDQGTLRFVERGHYKRLDVQPAFSPLIDMEAAKDYISAAQKARVALETWATFNLYCLTCERDSLDQLRAGTPVADFECYACGSTYQLKAKNGRFGSVIPGAAYLPTLQALRSSSMPDYILVEYDPRFKTVVYVDAIPGSSISEERIIPRKPLSGNARRAGQRASLPPRGSTALRCERNGANYASRVSAEAYSSSKTAPQLTSAIFFHSDIASMTSRSTGVWYSSQV